MRWGTRFWLGASCCNPTVRKRTTVTPRGLAAFLNAAAGAFFDVESVPPEDRTTRFLLSALNDHLESFLTLESDSKDIEAARSIYQDFAAIAGGMDLLRTDTSSEVQ